MRILVLILLLLGIAAHAVLSHRFRSPANEDLLADAVSSAWTSDDRFSSASVTFHHLDGVVSGQVPDAEAKAALLAVARDAKPAGRLLDAVTILPPRDQPIILSLTRPDGSPRLFGSVGTLAIKNLLVQALGAVPVSDVTVSDRVMEPDWAPDDAGRFLARFLERVPDGTLDFKGNDLVLRGKTQGEEAREAVLADARSLLPPGGNLKAEIDLLPDRPPRLTVHRSGERWTLDGQLPDPASIAPILAALGAKTAAVTNRVTADPRVLDSAWNAVLPPFLKAFFAGGDGSVSLDGASLTLAGDRPASLGRAPWLDALSPLKAAGCEISDQIRLVPDLDPTLAVTSSPEGWVLEGRVPDEATRKRIADTATSLAGSTPLRNGLTANPAVRSAPWLAETEALLRALFGSGRPGQLSLGGKNWKLAGNATSAPERDALVARVTPWVPPGTTLDAAGFLVAAPTPPPTPPPAPAPMPAAAPPTPKELPWVHLHFTPTERRLEGRLGDNSSLALLESGMKPGEAPSVPLRNDLQISGDVAPAPWIPPVSRFLPRFSASVREGSIEVKNGKLTLNGEAKDAATRDTLLSELSSSLPNGMVKIEDRMTLTPAKVAMPASTPDGSWPTYKVYFNKNSTYLRPEDSATIVQSAAALGGLQADATVLVKGFSDHRGHAIGNQILSEERATVVKDRLISLGVPADRIELIGVGESESQTGKSERVWKLDRRVEIIVVRK